jgi:glycosyltransferase involved in cell wall biosynthesis
MGGYELGCRDIVAFLKARGHNVKVLTSTYGVGKTMHDEEVYRWLETGIKEKALGLPKHPSGILSKAIRTYTVFKFLHRIYKFINHYYGLVKKEVNNQNAFKRLCFTFKPDVIYVWNLAYVSVSMIFRAQVLGLPVCYYVFDNWLSRWETDPWYALWNRRHSSLSVRIVMIVLKFFLKVVNVLTTGSLDLQNAQYSSYYLKQFALQCGKEVTNTKVVHWGIDTNRFPFNPLTQKPTRLLYVGQIFPHKGVHTAIDAVKVLINEYGCDSVILSIVGGNMLSDYGQYLKNMVGTYNLESNVHFTGFLSHKHLASVYQEHDIFLFTSIWDEPFGITLLEAMSSGLAVIGTATGGSSEILHSEINGLVFPKEDAKACADQILRLMNDQALFEKIRQNGKRTVEKNFQFEQTVNSIEDLLQQVIPQQR